MLLDSALDDIDITQIEGTLDLDDPTNISLLDHTFLLVKKEPKKSQNTM
jgi:hypothetical protein